MKASDLDRVGGLLLCPAAAVDLKEVVLRPASWMHREGFRELIGKSSQLSNGGVETLSIRSFLETIRSRG
jgi:hypothetical protein